VDSVSGRDRHPAIHWAKTWILPAQLVVCDLDALKTLPDRELSWPRSSSMGRLPTAFLGWLETNLERCWPMEPAALAHAVSELESKAWVVGQDERGQACTWWVFNPPWPCSQSRAGLRQRWLQRRRGAAW
jgi:hypothetical protein